MINRFEPKHITMLCSMIFRRNLQILNHCRKYVSINTYYQNQRVHILSEATDRLANYASHYAFKEKPYFIRTSLYFFELGRKSACELGRSNWETQRKREGGGGSLLWRRQVAPSGGVPTVSEWTSGSLRCCCSCCCYCCFVGHSEDTCKLALQLCAASSRIRIAMDTSPVAFVAYGALSRVSRLNLQWALA
jgi:hypothetical protein